MHSVLLQCNILKYMQQCKFRNIPLQHCCFCNIVFMLWPLMGVPLYFNDRLFQLGLGSQGTGLRSCIICRFVLDSLSSRKNPKPSGSILLSTAGLKTKRQYMQNIYVLKSIFLANIWNPSKQNIYILCIYCICYIYKYSNLYN